jgi:mRNA-degrading endonuclease RelE of RelBE toxin-antitoxin system
VARAAIEKKLKVDPEKYGQRLHSLLHGLYKLKASHIRIAYHIEGAAREVWILMIGDRRDIWDQDQAEILKRLGIVRVQVDRDVPG